MSYLTPDPKYKKETLKAYNTNSEEYAKKFDGAFQYHKISLEKFLSKFNSPSYILDLACGAGTYATRIRDVGHHVTCLDNSRKMLEIASSRKLTGMLIDVEKQDFGFESYEGVWCMTGITHIPKDNVNRVFHRISKSMTRNGLLFLGIHEGTENQLVEEGKNTGIFRHMSKYSPGELEKVTKPYFKLEETWDTYGYGDVKFLNYIFRK